MDTKTLFQWSIQQIERIYGSTRWSGTLYWNAPIKFNTCYNILTILRDTISTGGYLAMVSFTQENGKFAIGIDTNGTREINKQSNLAMYGYGI